jgi:hypothetical protein
MRRATKALCLLSIGWQSCGMSELEFLKGKLKRFLQIVKSQEKIFWNEVRKGSAIA